jgi:hypothetical protein
MFLSIRIVIQVLEKYSVKNYLLTAALAATLDPEAYQPIDLDHSSELVEKLANKVANYRIFK